MGEPDAQPPDAERGRPREQASGGPHYGRYVGILAVLILILITINTLSTKPNGDTGIPPGRKVAPFAVPLALAPRLTGDADVATAPNQGAAGKVAACDERGAEILNICELYEQGPVVLAMFVEGGSCPNVLSEMQALVGSFPQVRFAAVALRGGRKAVRRIIARRHLAFPVGIDSEGTLAALYEVATCPQVAFLLQGGIVQSKALLTEPAPQALRARVAELLAASRAARGST
jgi:AhpC/TSA family